MYIILKKILAKKLNTTSADLCAILLIVLPLIQRSYQLFLHENSIYNVALGVDFLATTTWYYSSKKDPTFLPIVSHFYRK